ncbi:MAG: hypothetical protein ACLQVF_00870 [Isosphaeraceae bacterium]
MNTNYRTAVYDAIDAKLSALLNEETDRPGWYEAWQRLRLASTDEERLSVYQAIRDSGVLPEDAGFHLVSWQVDQIAERLAKTALRDFDERLDSIRRAHGLAEDEYWGSGEGPPEYVQVNQEYDRADDDLFTQTLEAHGEHAIATLYRTDKEAYERRNEAGRQYFHGPIRPAIDDDSEWLDFLLDHVGACIRADSPIDSLWLQHREEEGFWEVDIFPTAVELIGGAEDGAVVNPLFSVDLEQLRLTFDRVDDFGWNALGWHDGDGPFVWVEGAHLGRPLYLRVLAEDPRDDEPRAKLYVR